MSKCYCHWRQLFMVVVCKKGIDMNIDFGRYQYWRRKIRRKMNWQRSKVIAGWCRVREAFYNRLTAEVGSCRIVIGTRLAIRAILILFHSHQGSSSSFCPSFYIRVYLLFFQVATTDNKTFEGETRFDFWKVEAGQNVGCLQHRSDRITPRRKLSGNMFLHFIFSFLVWRIDSIRVHCKKG